MKKSIFFIIATLVAMPLLSFAVIGPVSAQVQPEPQVDLKTDLFKGGAEADEQIYNIEDSTGLGDKDPREIIAQVINVVLGFLGIIAVLLIVVGGFRWMTASGNDEAIAGAKNLMIAGVVGLIIILAAFGIARFVVDALVKATATSAP